MKCIKMMINKRRRKLCAATIRLTQLGSARVAGIHCDKNANRWHQRYRIAHEDKRRSVILFAE